MFLVGQLGAVITADRKPFNKVLDSVFRDGGRQMQALGSRMTKAITLPLLGAGALAVKTAADYEKLQTSMAILNGSVEEGARNFERLKEFSARTPFQLSDLARAQNMLQGFGLAADEAFESISMIGDIAAVSGGSIEGIGIAFGQAAAEGRLMTRDIRQLINQGVPAIKLLAETMGVAQSEIFDLASQGEITFDILQQAFRDATSEGGMFADGMKKQSQTISGLFSTLKDNVSLSLGELGNSIVDTLDLRNLVKDLTTDIQTITKRFTELSDDAQTQIIKMAGLFAAGGPLLIGLGVTAQAIHAFSTFLTKRFILITGSIGVALAAWESFNNSINVLLGREDKILGFMGSMKRGFERILTPLFDMVSGSLGMSGSLDNLLTLFKDLPDVVDETSDSVDGANTSNKQTTESFNTLTKSVDRFRVAMQAPLDDIVDPIAIAEAREEMELMSMSLDNLMNLQTDFSHRINETSGSFQFAMDIANDFTQSFGEGLANVLVRAESLSDTLKNIGSLLASSIIQKALSLFLTGGLSGGGFFGSGGGLFGKIFGGFRAGGGSVFAGQTYRVGENNNPEMFIPSTNGTIHPMQASSKMVRITLNNNMDLDGRIVFTNQRNIEYNRNR